MNTDSPTIPNFIIGGTEKSGTTSVFVYLSQHPEVCASSKKETDFFRGELSGDPAIDHANYASFFTRCTSSTPIVMEASPGYLSEAATVAPRMAKVIPAVKLLFVLRNPVDRLYSAFCFHAARLNIRADISFEAYVDKCLAYERDPSLLASLGVDEWYLKTMGVGRYADSLQPFYALFPDANIRVMFFDELKADVQEFMNSVSRFLDIDATYWSSYEFQKENVTFSVANDRLHKLALAVNDRTESILRRRPGLKRALVGIYKRLNRAREGYEPMSQDVQRTVDSYYAPHLADLEALIGRPVPDAWRQSTSHS